MNDGNGIVEFNVNENALTISAIFGIDSKSIENTSVLSLGFSKRTENGLMRSGLKCMADVLDSTPYKLYRLKNLGKKSFDEIVSKIEELRKTLPESCLLSGIEPKDDTMVDDSSLDSVDAQIRKDLISRNITSLQKGDFEKVLESSSNELEIKIANELKKSCEVLGIELFSKSINYPEYSYVLSSMFKAYYIDTSYIHSNRISIENALLHIPQHRRNYPVVNLVTIFTDKNEERKKIIELFGDEQSPIKSISSCCKDVIKTDLSLLLLFLNWCSFDINHNQVVNDAISKIMNNSRMYSVLSMRAQRKTLEEVGQQLGVTRERVRQIEAKAIRVFSNSQKQYNLIQYISADKNGADIIYESDLVKYFGEDTDVIVYLLASVKTVKYKYEQSINGFIVGTEDLYNKTVMYVEESVPTAFNKSQLDQICETAFDEYGLPKDLLKQVVEKQYNVTGDIYHRNRLTKSEVYEKVLSEFFPEGIHITDDNEIAAFRNCIVKKYGDVDLPQNNRAIAARLASIGTLYDRGTYIAKREKWISDELEDKIYNYIQNNENPVLLISMVFSSFENELLQEGVTNRYFLQGILKDLFGDQFFFRRDYISRDKEFSSIYSAIIDYIKQHKYPVKKAEIQLRFKGITDIVIAMATGDSDIINYYGEYLHKTQLVVYDDEKEYLRRSLNKYLDDNEAHHIKDIYPLLMRDKPEVFSRNAANDTYCAFSLLECLFKDTIQFSRPYLAKIGVEIGKPMERLREQILAEDEYSISDISAFQKENHIQIASIVDFINSLNEKVLIKDMNTIVSIEKAEINNLIALQVENIIDDEVNETMPIRNLSCLYKLPQIAVKWSEWLIYSTLYKWSDKLDVALSSSQFRQSMPLVAPKGKMDLSQYKDVAVSPMTVTIDNLDNIDELIADLITEEMLEDV